ncbi:PD-(D/E)XK motif protein [Pseudomonas putida]|nr:PD-(D/E)XK motif protein [Pseudomonas putida]
MDMTAETMWALLRSGSHTDSDFQIRTIPTNVVTLSGKVRLALGPNEEPRVLLPLGDRETISRSGAGDALALTVSCFTYQGRSARFIDLVCLSMNLETVFGEVVDEILARVAASTDCVSAVESTIADFRSLLMQSSDKEVAPTIVVGLIGELLFLNRLLDISASGWRAWCGPSGDRHDFRRGGTSLEIKSTIRAGQPTIVINGLEQLEIPDNGSLHILHLVLESVPSGNLSISGLATSALRKADEPERLQKLLAAIGCEDFDKPRWNCHSFRVQSELLYEVRDGFPRLTSSMLLAGVAQAGLSAITYSIDLLFASPFLASGSAYKMIERELGECL